MSATQQGVEDIHAKLMAKLAPTEEPAEPIVDEETEVDPEVDPEVIQEDNPVREEEPSEDDDTEGEEPSEAPTIELSHIAEYLGVESDKFDVSDDGELLVKTKIDGEEGRAKFSDLLKSYQLEGHLNKQNTETAELKKSLQSKIAEADAQLAQKAQQLEALSQIAYNELMTEYSSIDWNDLRADDPAEYAAKLADYQNKQARIADLYQKAIDQRKDISAHGDVDMNEKAEKERAALLAAIPDWVEPEKYKKGWTENSDYAQSLGFTSDEINSVLDHRFIVLLDKARQFDALNKGKPEIANRVRKAPKIAKPGSTANTVPSKVAKEQKLKQQLKRDGGGNALRELLLSRV